jgi:hypothetical protein
MPGEVGICSETMKTTICPSEGRNTTRQWSQCGRLTASRMRDAMAQFAAQPMGGGGAAKPRSAQTPSH